MNVNEIVGKYLEQNGFDGLFNEDCECACQRDDLSPCGRIEGGCEAGKLAPCDCGDHDYHIVRATRREPNGHCTEGDRCVCGGDTPAVRAGCANWVTPNAAFNLRPTNVEKCAATSPSS